jgi:hypothetical protein
MFYFFNHVSVKKLTSATKDKAQTTPSSNRIKGKTRRGIMMVIGGECEGDHEEYPLLLHSQSKVKLAPVKGIMVIIYYYHYSNMLIIPV